MAKTKTMLSLISIMLLSVHVICLCGTVSCFNKNNVFCSGWFGATLSPKIAINASAFEKTFSQNPSTRLTQVELAIQGVDQALGINDFSSAWDAYHNVIARFSALDIYEKANIRLRIENAEKKFAREEVIQKAKEEHNRKTQELQQKVQQEGTLAILEPLLEEGRSYSRYLIRVALRGNMDVELIASSKIEGLRLVSDGIFAQANLYAPYVGNAVAGELVLENNAIIHFLLFFNAQGDLARIFIGSHTGMEDEGEFAGYDPLGVSFVSISNDDIIDASFSLDSHRAISALKKRISNEAAQFSALEKRVQNAISGYQILRPVVHDQHSRDSILQNLRNTMGLEKLQYFIATSRFAIPEDVVYVRNLGHPRSAGLIGGVEINQTIFTNDKVFGVLTFIHETTHAFFILP